MKNLIAKEVMVESVVTIRKGAFVKDAMSNLLYGSMSGLPVVDDENKLAGMVTEFDVLDATLQGKDLETTRIAEIMTPAVITANQDTPILEIAKVMKENNLIRIPIMEGEKLVGIVGRCDILKGLMKPEWGPH